MARSISGILFLKMEFNKTYYEKEFEKLLNSKEKKKFFIKKSSASFKINKFIKKGIDSFELADFVNKSKLTAKNYWTIIICYYSMLYLAKAAILTKGYETDDHYATQIALGYLLIPDTLEREDLELLDQAHKIFEDEYIDYFEDARKESSISRYSPSKVYAERRIKEIMEISRKFIQKIRMILEE
ncbi:HEPN domain-containing protein [Candidatus Woesearchaeota archaeon]|nr:HEPN domain-containing protein [Candidatus Woesearchaeota archaeon]